mgnify:CR=1 FL=1
MTTPEHSSAPVRYAVYFAPGQHDPWWDAGSRWLGRCAVTGQALPQPAVAGLSAAQFAQLTQAPRRYGWHATLKAPFVLADGCTLAALQNELSTLARRHRAFELPPLVVSQMDGFMGLRLDGDDHAVQHIAANCVTGLNTFAAPLPPSELVRRRGKGLSDRQEQLLKDWGYPFVLDQFRFHFSLTGALTGAWPEALADVTPTQVDALKLAAQQHFAALPPCRFDQLALFEEARPGAPFAWVSSHALKA